jgi:glycosyltransferase involved in cell wall biosynthesis
MFDSITEEIVIEKTPEHCFYLDIVEQLRKVCKRDIHVIYLTRPPVPTILSILRAKEVWSDIDILGACEKYKEAMVSIYHNLIVKINVSFGVSYRDLIEDTYFTLYNLLVNELYLNLSDSDIRSLVVNRIDNLRKVLPQVEQESHHSNLFREVDVVNRERADYARNLSPQDVIDIKYISSYFTNLLGRYSNTDNLVKKFNIHDLVTKKKVISIEDVPLVTIVVPLYNKEKYIEETLSSLLNQTYQKIHIIVVDDGSADNSLEIVDTYIKSLDESSKCKISILTQDHFGVSESRNRGLPFSGDIISFCDADDTWNLTLVEKSVATFKRYPYVDCVYSRVLIDKDGEITKNHSKICNGDVYEDTLEYNFLTCGSNLFVKASVLKEHNIKFNTDYNGCEDWDFLIQLAQVAVFKCTKEYLVTYRQTPDSLSTNKELQVDNGKKVLESYITDNKKFKRIFTRLYLYYLPTKNLKWEHIKDLDFSYILRVVVNKLKSFVKSHIL